MTRSPLHVWLCLTSFRYLRMPRRALNSLRLQQLRHCYVLYARRHYLIVTVPASSAFLRYLIKLSIVSLNGAQYACYYAATSTYYTLGNNVDLSRLLIPVYVGVSASSLIYPFFPRHFSRIIFSSWNVNCDFVRMRSTGTFEVTRIRTRTINYSSRIPNFPSRNRSSIRKRGTRVCSL